MYAVSQTSGPSRRSYRRESTDREQAFCLAEQRPGRSCRTRSRTAYPPMPYGTGVDRGSPAPAVASECLIDASARAGAARVARSSLPRTSSATLSDLPCYAGSIGSPERQLKPEREHPEFGPCTAPRRHRRQRSRHPIGQVWTGALMLRTSAIGAARRCMRPLSTPLPREEPTGDLGGRRSRHGHGGTGSASASPGRWRVVALPTTPHHATVLSAVSRTRTVRTPPTTPG